ncbi:MAG: 30S ribosomal protein S1 [Enterobacteriaceae bacterium]
MLKKFCNIFKKVFKKINIKQGSLLKGYIISIDKELVYIDVGLKSLTSISIEEFKNIKKKIKIGDKINVVLDFLDNGLGETIVSYEKAQYNQEWLILEKALKNSTSMFGYINGRTKGGFNVDLNNIKAFLPGSLVDIRPIRDITYLEGKKLEFKIIKLDKKRNNIVISRKAVIKREYNSIKKKSMKLIKEGINIKGIVKNLTDYGAFIDIGGLDGLLHITDMSWKRIKHPIDIVNIGDEIILKVIKFDNLNKRISLGLKQRFLDPWNNIMIRYPKGFITKGRVCSLTNYGCFVEIEDGIEGLVHTSEMEWKKKKVNPYRLIKINKQVKVMILNIDKKKRRISLGMKQCKINPWKVFLNKKKNRKYVKGIVKSITDFGIFVGLFDGIDGLIHLTDISWNILSKKNINKYKKGDIIKSIILQIDIERERISLGIKQLYINNFNKFLITYKKNDFIYCKIILITFKKIVINLGNKLIGYLYNFNNNINNIILNNKKIIKLNFISIKNKKIIILSL